MDRFMLHLKNTGYSPHDTGTLLADARRLAGGLDAIIRDCRVATKYVEFDVSIDKSYMDDLVRRLVPIAPLDHARLVTEEHMEKAEAIKMGVFYFNEERFWEAQRCSRGCGKSPTREKRISYKE